MKTKVRDIYEHYKENPDEYLADICIETFKEEASKDPIEFQDLINIFNEEKKMKVFHYALYLKP